MALMVGYARVSTVLQDVDAQLAALLELGVPAKRIYTDTGFSRKTMTRAGLEQALAAVRPGDTFVVSRLDRLARNVEGALTIISQLTDEGVVFQNGRTRYDPADPMSKMVMTILLAVAEAEGGWISLRTREAMARPSVRQKMKGRQPSLSPAADAAIAAQLAAGEYSASTIATMFRTSRAGVYRASARHQNRLLDPSRSRE